MLVIAPIEAASFVFFLVKKHKNIAYGGTIFKLKKVCVLLKKLFQ